MKTLRTIRATTCRTFSILGLYRYFRDVYFFREADPDNASTEEIVLTEAKAFFKLAVEAAINYPHVR